MKNQKKFFRVLGLIAAISLSGCNLTSSYQSYSTATLPQPNTTTEIITSTTEESSVSTTEDQILLVSYSEETKTEATEITTTTDVISETTIPPPQINKELIVHFIDVGQGDSILIHYQNKNTNCRNCRRSTGCFIRSDVYYTWHGKKYLWHWMFYADEHR